MDHIEALKQIQSKKPKENFLVIEIGYDNKIILPFKDGVALMAVFGNAEKLSEPYNKPKRILPFERETIKTHVMSHSEYEDIKVANLLNITVEELYETRNPPEKVPF